MPKVYTRMKNWLFKFELKGLTTRTISASYTKYQLSGQLSKKACIEFRPLSVHLICNGRGDSMEQRLKLVRFFEWGLRILNNL